jgi:GR25 family glycosyltransferase involved in LPS biosynthesis
MYNDKENAFFEKAFCINLERRSDRWENAKKQFDSLNMQIDRIPAVDGSLFNLNIEPICDSIRTPGALGCSLSHLFIMKTAKYLNLKNYIVFEDDVEFSENFIYKFTEIFNNELPKDWDILYLGGHHVEKPTKISENIYKCNYTVTTHAIAFNESIYDLFIPKLNDLSRPCDVHYADEQKNINAYVIYPPLCWQYHNYSDIVERMSNASDKERLLLSFSNPKLKF